MNTIDHNPRLNAAQLEKLYIQVSEKLKPSLQALDNRQQKIELFANELAQVFYDKLIALYALKPERDDLKRLRTNLEQFLQLAKDKKYKHAMICQRMRFDVIEPFEDKILLPRALKLTGNALKTHEVIMDLFQSRAQS